MTWGVAAGTILPVDVLMKSPPAAMPISLALRTTSSEPSSPVSRMTLRCARAAGLFRGGDLVEHLAVVAREHRAAVDDHVDLVGAELHRAPHVVELHGEGRLPARKRRGDARDLHARARERLLRGRDEVRVDADRGDGADRSDRASSGRSAFWHSCRTLPGGVLPFERREVHHRDGELQAGDLRALLDGPLAERGDPLVDGDLVDRGRRGIEVSRACPGAFGRVSWPYAREEPAASRGVIPITER